jgi:YD repeat-containing protein
MHLTFYSNSGAVVAEATSSSSAPTTLTSATMYQYDSNGWLTTKSIVNEKSTFSKSTLEDDIDDPTTPTLTWIDEDYTYDDYGRRLTVTKDSGTGGKALETTYSYNHQSEVVKITYPDGRYRKTERDGRGLKTKEILGKDDTDIAITEFYYDLNGNLIKKVDPEGVTELYEYDGFDRMVQSRRGRNPQVFVN